MLVTGAAVATAVASRVIIRTCARLRWSSSYRFAAVISGAVALNDDGGGYGVALVVRYLLLSPQNIEFKYLFSCSLICSHIYVRGSGYTFKSIHRL